jgi:DNA primase
MIPDEVITQIREAADIVTVIGQYVQLKKAGRNWKGLCPFHGEKTPSFNVHPDRGTFYCFGCQKKGDAFSFIQELEGKSFVEAVEQLANRFGIAVPKIDEPPEVRRARGERVAMLDINKVATAFYRELLADARGEAGRAYLAKRGVTQETADRFQLGYAPGEWSALADHLKAKRVDMELAVRLGLVAHRPRNGGYYDRNRDRLVCPVVVPGGDIVGFSSRLVGTPQKAPDGSEPPKYINSPESSVYKKSKLLFGLAQAREHMQTTKRAVLVEGNFDVISLSQAGFGEVVAPLGTALTAEQIGVLKRLTERIVLLYDGDRAGYKATMHALQICVEAEVEVLVARRPGHGKSGGAGMLADGVDPDSLVASGGSELLREAVDRAQGGIEFFANEVWGKARGNADARTRALEDAGRLLTKVANPVKRDLLVHNLATALGVDIAVVRGAIARASSSPAHGHGRSEPPRGVQGGRPGGGTGGHPNAPGGHPNAPGSGDPGDRGDYDRGDYDDRGDRDSNGEGGNRGWNGGGGNRWNGGGNRGWNGGGGNRWNGGGDRGDRGGDRGWGGGDRGRSGDRGGRGWGQDRPEPVVFGQRVEGAPPIDEAEVIALLVDHPSLIATAEADKAFWLLTDTRLRAMYSAAREGQSLPELAPVNLPKPTAEHVLSGKYAGAKDPRADLVKMITNLEARRGVLDKLELQKSLDEAKRTNDQQRARLMAQLAVAERKGDRDEVARIKDLLAEMSPEKKVD